MKQTKTKKTKQKTKKKQTNNQRGKKIEYSYESLKDALGRLVHKGYRGKRDASSNYDLSLEATATSGTIQQKDITSKKGI